MPVDMLRDETVALARELMGKNPVALALTKQAMRKVKTMDAPQAYEYLMTKIHELMFAEPEQTRNRGIEEFIDKKTYRPGLEAVKPPE